MTAKRDLFLRTAALGLAGLMAIPFLPAEVQAGDWHFSLHVPYRYRHYYRDYDRCYHDRHGWDYYPIYNPVVDRDVWTDGHRHWDGTHHSDTHVEDRHASYYSRGRNTAITPPRTSVRESYGPRYNQTRERTSWIGADGRPHSTTVTRTNTRDAWGNTHTDTHVSLKNKRGSKQSSKPRQIKAPKAPELPKPHKAPRVSNKVPNTPKSSMVPGKVPNWKKR